MRIRSSQALLLQLGGRKGSGSMASMERSHALTITWRAHVRIEVPILKEQWTTPGAGGQTLVPRTGDRTSGKNGSREIGRTGDMTAQVTSRIVKGVAVVSVDGELDVHTSPKLRSSIRHMLAEGQCRIIVNLLKTTYLDGQALAVLTATQQQARAAGGNVGFVHSQPLFTRLFALAGVRGSFPAFRTEALAVRAAGRWTKTSPRA